MQTLVWIVRFLIIVILVWFALKNSQQVEVNGFPGQVWQTPLVFALLIAFVAGAVMGLLAWIPTVVRQRREIGRLKRDAEKQAALCAIAPMAPPAPVVSPPGPHGV
jgi:uncharacterized integral membrane protein